MLHSVSRARRALIRSQSGPGSGLAFAAAPTGPEFTLSPERFQTLARRRLRWPLPLAAAQCEGCGHNTDEFGDHRGACMRSGRVKIRAGPIEHTVARICREAGARVQTNVALTDLNVAVPASDERRIEVLAAGLPCFGGAQLAVDVTLRSPLCRRGLPRDGSHWLDGAAAATARVDKQRTYPELCGASRCRLVVLCLETGGRMSAETVAFLHQIAEARARSCPGYLRRPSAFAFERRWARMLAVSAASSFAASLLLDKEELAAEPRPDGAEPWLQDLLSGARLEVPPAARA